MMRGSSDFPTRKSASPSITSTIRRASNAKNAQPAFRSGAGFGNCVKRNVNDMEPKPRRGLAMFLVAAIFLVPFSIAVSVWYSSLRPKAPKAPKVDVTEGAVQVAGQNNEFALALYQQLRSQEGNLFFSPHSLSTAMAMSYAGAAGATKTEI